MEMKSDIDASERGSFASFGIWMAVAVATAFTVTVLLDLSGLLIN